MVGKCKYSLHFPTEMKVSLFLHHQSSFHCMILCIRLGSPNKRFYRSCHNLSYLTSSLILGNLQSMKSCNFVYNLLDNYQCNCQHM